MMDRSQVKAIVDAHVESLIGRLGIPHWKIVIDYDLRSTSSQGECNWLVDYNQASISLDPDRLEDEAHVLKVLRHELFHVVLSPFTIFFNAVRPAIGTDPVRTEMAESVWVHASEKAVINLERMYLGLAPPPDA